jgi:hypothetical protein
MSQSTIKRLTIESLGPDVSVIPVEAVGFYKHNCMICLDKYGYQSGVQVKVHHDDQNDNFEVCWNGVVTEEIRRAYRDQNKATDFAACSIALLLVPQLTEFTAVEQSNVGTTIDYYLAPKTQDDTLIFNHAARLEVSGILEENKDNTVDGRIQRKVRRLKPDPRGSLPTFIVVVEFSQPWAKMVRYD